MAWTVGRWKGRAGRQQVYASDGFRRYHGVGYPHQAHMGERAVGWDSPEIIPVAVRRKAAAEYRRILREEED